MNYELLFLLITVIIIMKDYSEVLIKAFKINLLNKFTFLIRNIIIDTLNFSRAFHILINWVSFITAIEVKCSGLDIRHYCLIY